MKITQIHYKFSNITLLKKYKVKRRYQVWEHIQLGIEVQRLQIEIQ